MKTSPEDQIITTTPKKSPKPQDGQESIDTSQQSETTSTTSHEIEADFINKLEFSQAVLYHVQFYKTSIMEAILAISERIGLEPEHDADRISDLIDEQLLQRLTLECGANKTINVEQHSFLDC